MGLRVAANDTATEANVSHPTNHVQGPESTSLGVGQLAPYSGPSQLAYGPHAHRNPTRRDVHAARVGQESSSGWSAVWDAVKKAFSRPLRPGEVREPGQAAQIPGGGIAVLVPYEAIDPNLKTKSGLTPKQLFELSCTERHEHYFGRNRDGDELVIPGLESSVLTPELPDQTLHFHTHPDISNFNSNGGIQTNIPNVFSPADLSVYARLRDKGIVRGVFAPEGVLIYLDWPMSDERKPGSVVGSAP